MLGSSWHTPPRGRGAVSCNSGGGATSVYMPYRAHPPGNRESQLQIGHQILLLSSIQQETKAAAHCRGEQEGELI